MELRAAACSLCFLALVSCSQCRSAAAPGTKIKGGLYFDDVWTVEKSPYVLAGNAKIGKGTTIKVAPGVKILGQGHRFVLDGLLKVFGSAKRPVEIVDTHFAAGNSNEGRMTMEHAAVSGGSILSETHFKGRKAAVNITDSSLSHVEPIYLFYPTHNTSIERNVFYRSGGISAGTEAVVVTIRNNLFFRQTSDYAIKNWARYPRVIPQEETHDGKPGYFPTDMVVEHNTFLCSDQVALSLEPRYNDAYMRQAQRNFFGTAEAEEVAAMIHDRSKDMGIVNHIAYEPFLEAPHPRTPSRPEFICSDPSA